MNIDFSSNEYNDIPVVYCPICLSLDIRKEKDYESDEDICYCSKCGSTSLKTTTIFEWRELYRIRFGKYPEIEETEYGLINEREYD